jgi:hypothetical protein
VAGHATKAPPTSHNTPPRPALATTSHNRRATTAGAAVAGAATVEATTGHGC